jgi:DNA-binding CsgD family transcriptional regulator
MRMRTYGALSPSEEAVIEFAAAGYTAAETAHEMRVAEKTVRAHRYNAFRKLHARNIAHAVALFYDVPSMRATLLV